MLFLYCQLFYVIFKEKFYRIIIIGDDEKVHLMGLMYFELMNRKLSNSVVLTKTCIFSYARNNTDSKIYHYRTISLH